MKNSTGDLHDLIKIFGGQLPDGLIFKLAMDVATALKALH